MLMNVKCSAVASIKVVLTFDDGTIKERIIGTGDLVNIIYNGDGLRRHIQGKVINVSAASSDEKSWYIIVDSSDDFDANMARFSPLSILDCEIIRKNDSLENVRTVLGSEGVPFIRIKDGRLQYSYDTCEWLPILVDERHVIGEEDGYHIIDANDPCQPGTHHPSNSDDNEEF